MPAVLVPVCPRCASSDVVEFSSKRTIYASDRSFGESSGQTNATLYVHKCKACGTAFTHTVRDGEALAVGQ